MQNFQRILIIGYVWPEPDSSAAGQRMMQLISMFQSQNWEVIFASAATETENMANLDERDIETINIAINSSEFDDLIQQMQPSVVVFDRFVTEEQFGWRVAEYCPDALRILDTEDLHCLRKARKASIDKGHSHQETDVRSTEIAKRELASIWRSDLSMIISEAEISLLENEFEVKSDLLHYLPFLLDRIGKDMTDNWPDFEARSHFITVGNFRHAPNSDAIHYLKNEIWPLIKNKLSQAQLHIYGAYPTQKIIQLHNPEEGFCIKGRAKDAKSVVKKAKVCVAPLRFGAGLKGKLVEAMQCGTPSITTDIGAEGIAGKWPWSGKIANNSADIASAAITLYKDQSAWRQAQKNGIQIINKRFNADKFKNDLVDRMLKLQSTVEKHRANNFIGRMLTHHTMASTKYMSRWIGAKNEC